MSVSNRFDTPLHGRRNARPLQIVSCLVSHGSTGRASSASLRVPGMPPASAPDPLVARARLLLLGLFALNGLTFSSWLARLPTVRDELGLTTGQLGTVLLASSAGSLVMVMFAGALVTRYGGRRVLLVSTVGFTLAYVFMGIGAAVGSGLGGLASHGGVPLTVQFGVTAVVALGWRLGSISHVILDTGTALHRTDITVTDI